MGQAHEGRPRSPESLDASQLGRYQLVRLIQSGGMARVYEGRRESLAGVSVKVAVKVIRPEHAADDTFQTLFINEARIGAQLHHQNLVQIQDFDQEGNQFYLVMEYVEGLTVRKLISLAKRSSRPVPLAYIAEIGRQACEGLFYFHRARSELGTPLRLVHRDVKPSNLIINPQGVVKILDFGISKVLTATEKKGSVKGTWGFMSPEQATGVEIDGAADQYALAALLYELVALRPLFPDRSPEKIRDDMRVDAPAARAAQLGGDWSPLSRVLVRALQRDPVARFPDIRAMGETLFRLVDDPVRIGERLLAYTTGLANGSPVSAPSESPRSQDTMSRIDRRTPYQSGVPVGVGDRQRPSRSPPPPPLPGRPRSVLTRSSRVPPGYALLVAFGVSVIGFTGYRLWTEPSGIPEETIQAPPDALADAPAVPSPAPPDASAEDASAEDAAAEDAAAEDATEDAAAPVAAPVAAPAPAPAPVAVAAPVVATSATGTPAERGQADAARAAAIAAAIAGVGGDSEEAPEPSPAQGAVTLSSVPRARVLVDGQFIRYTPLFKYAIPAGAHAVELSTDDGRSKTFQVDVSADAQVRRVWLFDEDRWAD